MSPSTATVPGVPRDERCGALVPGRAAGGDVAGRDESVRAGAAGASTRQRGERALRRGMKLLTRCDAGEQELRRSGSRSAPRPCAGCRSRGRARGRSRSPSSRRMRPTSTSSPPAASAGSGSPAGAGRGRSAPRRGSRSRPRARAAPRTRPRSPPSGRRAPGTRTHVALIGRSGSSRILRVSARSFDSSSDSSPSQVQSITRSWSAGGSAAEPLHALRAGARDRLVGRDADALQAGRVVERLEHAGERDRAAVRVGDDPVALERLERAGAVHLGHDERVAVDEAVGGRLVDADRAARPTAMRDELAARARADREEEEVDVAGARAPPASPPRRRARRRRRAAACRPSAPRRTRARS